MKSLKLIIGLLFIYSCAPVNNTNSVNSSVNPSISVNPPVSPSSNLSIKPSVLNMVNAQPSISYSSMIEPPSSPNISTFVTPSATSINSPIANPVPTPSKQIAMTRILSSDSKIMVEGDFTGDKFYAKDPLYDYNNLYNTKEQFTGEIIYTDGTVTKDELVWKIYNLDIASVDQTGLVTTNNKFGNVSVYAFPKDDSSKAISFNVNVIDTFYNGTRDYNTYECINNKSNKVSKTEIIVKEKYSSTSRITGGPAVYISDDWIIRSSIFSGKVYDPNGNPVDEVTVNARSIYTGSLDTSKLWRGDTQITTESKFSFSLVPINTKIELIVAKDGWTTRTREIMTSLPSWQTCTSDNIFNFGGPDEADSIYALQDEPEITLLTINGRTVTSAASGDFLRTATPVKSVKPTPNQLAEMSINKPIPDSVGYLPYSTGVNSDSLEIEMLFSEPVNKEDVENNFRITSQSVFSSTADEKKPFINGVANSNFPNGESFIINKNASGASFTWSENDTKVIFRTNEALLANSSGKEARYLVDFDKYGFKDKSGKSAIINRQFRFSPSQINDYAVFSVSNK